MKGRARPTPWELYAVNVHRVKRFYLPEWIAKEHHKVSLMVVWEDSLEEARCNTSEEVNGVDL